MPSIETLRKVPLFSGLSEPELEALSACLGKRTFGKNVFIYHKDSPGHTLYIIESGRVRLFVLSESGQEISLDIHGPGEVFGELSVLDGQPRSTGAVALETTLTLTLQRDDLVRQLETSRRLARNAIEMLAARLRYTTLYAQGLAFLDVNSRVAAKLLELAEEGEIRMTQVELASWVAASRESVNKTLASFRNQGLIEIDAQRTTILDRRGLRRQITY